MAEGQFGTWRAWLGAAMLLVSAQCWVAPQAHAQQNAASESTPSGPIRLRQPTANDPAAGTPSSARERADMQRSDRLYRQDDSLLDPRTGLRRLPKRSDFETFVRRLANVEPQDLDGPQRLGAELMADMGQQEVQDGVPRVPADYLVAPGDELIVTIWGSVDADLRLTVDRSGQIVIPRVGSILVSGVRFNDLTPLLTQRVGQVFRNFQLSVSLGRIRQIRIFVTGFVDKPGPYMVSGTSTIIHGLIRAGGPSVAGSFRNIQLRRAGQVLSTYDLYDLLVKGDNGGDRTLQAEDVIHVGSVGMQVGLIGSVNRPSVLELKPNETVDDALRMVGGLTAVADRSRLAIERLGDRNDIRIVQLPLPEGLTSKLNSGDVARVFSAVEATLPVERQNKRVRVEGEVLRPGEYILPAGTSIEDALKAAGGLTTSAYIFGTEFNRETVRVTQQQNYERALRDLETELARASSTQRTSNADEAAALNARGQSTSRLVERLRLIKPSGRVVLQLEPDTSRLPNLALEDGDRLFIPSRPTTVGVFGSVFNGGSYLHGNGRKIGDFLRLAGGPTRGADAESVFVIRANGSVVSNLQRQGGWFSRGDSTLTELPALPGDTVFMPEELDKTTFTQRLKDWTQILSQFGLGLAAIKTLGN